MVQADLLGHARLQFLQGRIQNLLHQGRLAAATDPTDHAEYLQRNANVEVPEVVLPGTFDQDGLRPAPRPGRRADLQFSAQVLTGKTALIGDDGLVITLSHHFTTLVARKRPHINDMIGLPHHLFVVLHHHDRVIQITQMLQHADQPVRITRVQADGGFVKYIERICQIAAQASGELYPLAFSATEAIGQPVQRQITQAYIKEGRQALPDLQQDTPGDLLLMLRQGQPTEPGIEVLHLHGAKFSDMGTANLHIKSLRTKPVPATGLAGGTPAIAREQYPVLHLIKILFYLTKKGIYAINVRIPLPQRSILVGREIHHRPVNGESCVFCSADELFTPLSELLALPGCHSALVNT